MPVFWRGDGPGVLVMHELPGITPEVRRFAERLSDAGFTVAMPQLFGTPNRSASFGHYLQGFSQVCISQEFSLLAGRRTSPITGWLRALCGHLHQECGGPGVGALGMCLTGGFALALMMDPWLLAPVLSQPSLPLPVTSSRKAEIGLSDSDLAAVKGRCEKEDLLIVGLRFTEDPICPRARFETLRREFGRHFESIEIDSSTGNRQGIPSRAHSVLTKDYVDEPEHPTRIAMEHVLRFFGDRLVVE